MSFPSHHNLDCPPFGSRSVLFDVLEEEDEEYDVPVLPAEVADEAASKVIADWDFVWSELYSRVQVLLKDYEYGKTVAELLSEPKNTIYVTIISPDEDEKFRLDVAIDVRQEHGSHVFGVEFEELSPVDATATF